MHEIEVFARALAFGPVVAVPCRAFLTCLADRRICALWLEEAAKAVFTIGALSLRKFAFAAGHAFDRAVVDVPAFDILQTLLGFVL